MSFECLDCKAIDGGYCEDCATSNDELRQVIKRWHDKADEINRTRGGHAIYNNGRADAMREVADELKEEIEE